MAEVTDRVVTPTIPRRTRPARRSELRQQRSVGTHPRLVMPEKPSDQPRQAHRRSRLIARYTRPWLASPSAFRLRRCRRPTSTGSSTSFFRPTSSLRLPNWLRVNGLAISNIADGHVPIRTASIASNLCRRTSGLRERRGRDGLSTQSMRGFC